MKTVFLKDSWCPYVAGALVGILAIFSVVVSTKMLGKPKYLGASTTFVRVAGLIEKLPAKEHVARNEYFQSKKVQVDWQMMFVLGIFFGALVASLLGKSFKIERIPPMWAERFGSTLSTRVIAAFIGGTIAMFGARLAGGCPSGHGMSGMMQLALSSLIAMIFFLIGGIITAQLMYGRRQ